MNKLLVRLGVAGAVAAGTVWAVRKYRANQPELEEVLQQWVARTTETLDKSVAQATELANRVQTYFDVAMTQMATSWLGEPQTEEKEPEATQATEAEKPVDEYTSSARLLDDSGR
jgi:hypothetical protein